MYIVSIAGLLGLVIGLFVLLIPIALLVVLQVWLCRKSRKLGLILPILSLALSLVLVLSIGSFTRVGGGAYHVADEYGQVIVHEEHHGAGWILSRDTILPVAAVFLVGNIPTAVFSGIWLHYKGRQDMQDDLKRMRIEDLE